MSVLWLHATQAAMVYVDTLMIQDIFDDEWLNTLT